MDIDKEFLSNMNKSVFMPIEHEIERVLTELGYTVENLRDGLFWVEKDEGVVFYVYASSQFPDRFSFSTVAHIPPEVKDGNDFVGEVASVARENGTPKIYAGMWNDTCYISQTFRRRNNKILPSRLQRNIDEFFDGYLNFVSVEKLIFETFYAMSGNNDEATFTQ